MSRLKEPRENSETENSTHAYTVQFAPRNWSGRLVVGLVLATLLFLVLLFFSMFLAFGAVIIGLSAVVGIFKYVTGRGGSEGMRTERDGTIGMVPCDRFFLDFFRHRHQSVLDFLDAPIFPAR